MDPEAGRAQAAQLLGEYDCCPRCVRRMLYGFSSQSTDFIQMPDAIRESPLCPICCGMLHHPRMCALPIDYERSHYQPAADVAERYLLADMVHTMDKSDFEYLACQFKLTEPINHLFREFIVWSRLHDMVTTGSNEISFYDPEWRTLHPSKEPRDCHFSADELNKWKRSRIPEKQVWWWIAQHTLSSVLKVPVIQQNSRVREPSFIKANDLDPAVCDPETVIMVVCIILSDNQTREEFKEFLERAQYCPDSALRKRTAELLRHFRPRPKWNGPLKRDPALELQTTEVGRNRLLQLMSDMWQKVTSPCLALRLRPNLPHLGSISLERVAPIVLAGRYVKFSRRLPQTPWVIDGKRKLPSSVEEMILEPIRESFGAGTRLNFVSAGREDVDARCLGLGRPFIVRVENYEPFVPDIIRTFSKGVDRLPEAPGPKRPPNQPDLLRLASLINARGEGKVMVRDLQIVSVEDANKTIKSGETDRDKQYRALCWCPNGGLSTELIEHLAKQCASLTKHPQPRNGAPAVWPPKPHGVSRRYPKVQFGPINVSQSTPIRVLHRRPLLARTRTINSFGLASFEAVMADSNIDLMDYEAWTKVYPVEELFVLHVHCAAGSYVKEFVHGDLGRCEPSLSSLLGRQLDLLALDVCNIHLNWPPPLPDPDVLPAIPVQ